MSAFSAPLTDGPSSLENRGPGLPSRAARPVLQKLEPFGPLPGGLRTLLTDAALRQLDSDMIIRPPRSTVSAPASCTADPTRPGGARVPIAATTLHPDDIEAAERAIEQVRTGGLAGHFKDLMRSFGRLLFALFFTSAQQARALACAHGGRPFTFLSSDSGGPSLASWRTVARAVGEGRVRLTVSKVWGIDAHREALAVVVSRLPGVAFPAAYLVWPEHYRLLDRQPCGDPFLEGSLQLGTVHGEIEVDAADRLRTGGALMLNRYLTTVRPFFVRALMAHVEWLADRQRVVLGPGAVQALAFIAAATRRQSRAPHYGADAIHAVLALKFASNTLLGALVREGSVPRFEDQRDLLAFTKMEGSCYRCYYELRRADEGPSAKAFRS